MPDSKKHKTLGDFIDENMTPKEKKDHRLFIKKLRLIAKEIDINDQKIIQMRFGLDGKGGHTLKEVGLKLGVTDKYIRKLESGVLSKINDIIFSEIKDANEIEILRNRSGKFNDFLYTYEEPTINLLKKNFKLKDSYYIIAKQNTVFVGFCSIDRDWWEDGFFMIREILVDPKFQKQGIGEKLMRMCINHAKKKKAIGVVTETSFKNIPMQKLCAKLNFKEWNNPQWKEGITYKLIF